MRENCSINFYCCTSLRALLCKLHNECDTNGEKKRFLIGYHVDSHSESHMTFNNKKKAQRALEKKDGWENGKKMFN